MKQVFTKEQLINAVKAGDKHIVCKGDIARTLVQERCKGIKNTPQHRRESSGFALFAGIAGLACIVAAPFTLGTSLGMGAAIGTGAIGVTSLGAGALSAGAGAIATGLTIGETTISTMELALICGTTVASLAILKDKKVNAKYNDDGSVELNID